MTFVKVAQTSDLAPGKAKRVEVQGKRISLFNVNGEFFALEDNCNHRGGPLSEGPLEEKVITCPWHGAQFDVTTGAALAGPAAMPMTTFKVRVVDGDVEIDL